RGSGRPPIPGIDLGDPPPDARRNTVPGCTSRDTRAKQGRSSGSIWRPIERPPLSASNREGTMAKAGTEGAARSVRPQVARVLLALGFVAAVLVNIGTEPPTVWGLVPIVLYALLVLVGTDVVLATGGALLVAIVMRGI